MWKIVHINRHKRQVVRITGFIFKQAIHWQHFFIGLCGWYYEKYSLHHSDNLHCRVVAWCVCLERYGNNTHSYCAGCYFAVVRHHPKSVGFSIQSFSYTRSILSARLQFSTVAVFFHWRIELSASVIIHFRLSQKCFHLVNDLDPILFFIENLEKEISACSSWSVFYLWLNWWQ